MESIKVWKKGDSRETQLKKLKALQKLLNELDIKQEDLAVDIFEEGDGEPVQLEKMKKLRSLVKEIKTGEWHAFNRYY